MSGWPHARVRTRLRLGVGLSVVAPAAASLCAIAPPAVAATTPSAAPAVPNLVAAHGLGKLTTRKQQISNAAAGRAHPVGTTRPATASAAASLPTTMSAHALVSGTPVWAQRVKGSPTGGVTVTVQDHATAVAAGVTGMVCTAATKDTAGRVEVGVHYGGFADRYGGDHGLSLRLVELPTCAPSTPQIAACRTQTPLPSVNDATTGVGVGRVADADRPGAATDRLPGDVGGRDPGCRARGDTHEHGGRRAVLGEQIVASTSNNTTTVTGTRIFPLPGGGAVVRDGAGSDCQFELTKRQGTGVLTLSSALQSHAWRQFTPYGATRGTPPTSRPDKRLPR